ncbi:MAG TPA: type VI secretion protein VasK, partial [Leclercia adecarboxylata]|nr:type VI secretion protein VasK [Leclercia adecarboxylata]
MEKKKRLSTWLIILLISIIGGFLIWTENPVVHLLTTEKKLIVSLAVAGVCLFILLCDDLFVRLWQWLISQSFIQQLRKLSDKSHHREEILFIDRKKHCEVFKSIHRYLHHTYGRTWSRKLRILLVTGSVTDAEQLAPKLTQELWQEDKGTLLLWGGDLNTPADTDWLAALRKLRRCPVDGIVWVTSQLDSPTENATPVLTPDAMDTLAASLSARYTALGWKLPLYVWSLHSRTGQQAGRVTQPVGCLLPPDCRADGLNNQLAILTPGLVTQGIQQICTKVQHNFLLGLADQLSRVPETVTEPLSILLNPYRPLPLAGVVFSPPSVGAARSVKHHWGKDNRWDIITDSVQSLPAGLRPRKPGITARQVLAGAVILVMAGWAITMAASFTVNRSLVARAQGQVQLVSAEKQPLATRLHALSELQKTLSRLQYRADRGAPWYTRGGLSQNDALMAALFPRYAENAIPLLRDAAAVHLQQQLNAYVQLPPDSPLREKMTRT